LHLARQVRHYSNHPFHQHELTAVVHLVFLDAEQHLEACPARRRHSGRHGDPLAQKFIRQTFQPLSKAFAVLAQ
jgi:hypothetical protein